MTTLRKTHLLVGCVIAILSVSGCISPNGKQNEGAASQRGVASEDLDFDSEGGDSMELDDSGDGAVEPSLAEEELSGDDGNVDDLIAEPAAPQNAQQAPKTNVVNEPMDSGSAISDVTITDIKYLSKQSGGTVVIQTTGPATYKTREVPSQNQLVVEIANARLPDRLKRPFVTKDFKQSIDAINAYQDSGSTTARVVIQFKGPMGAAVSQSGSTLTIVPSGADSHAIASGGEYDDSSMEDGSSDGVVTAGGVSNANDERILPTSSLEKGNSDDMRFYGRPISLEFRDTPVRDVINMIAEQSGANILISSEVDGAVSLKLKQIPWDQALLLVMKSRNLGYVRQGSVLRVAPIQSLQRETEDAKKVLDAQKAAEPLKVKVIPVGYAKVAELQAQVSTFLSARGKAAADPRTSSLIVTDIPENLERISNLVKALDTPPLQVLIEGKVVEAREAFSRDIGINWGFTGKDMKMGGKTLRPGLSVKPGLPGSSAITGTIRLGVLDVLGDLTASLALYERENLVKVVSSPRVVTLNNEAASIAQINQLPTVKETITNGATQRSVEFKDVQLRLDVTPQITSGDDVILQINIKREFPGARIGDATPEINTREAKTKVLVRNGRTAVIGGIYQSDTTETEQGVPWLRNIPVLGWLFKSKNTTADKNELLLFLTPRVLNAEQGAPKEGTL